MYRTALRTSSRALRASGTAAASASSRRFASTAAAPSRGTWKGAAARWGLAIGAVYWYNTSPLFADEPAVHARPAPPHFSESDDRTVDALIEEKRHQALKDVPVTPPSESTTPAQALPDTAEKDETTLAAEALEEEAGQQGAFNPETGEINWDCPCLGGMAHGPCGEDFKAAFSCFVYSNEEPKGMECIDKFQHMQDCFRLHPEIYAAELAEDEDDEPVGGFEDAAPATATESVKEAVELPREEAHSAAPTANTSHSPSSASESDLDESTQSLREEAEDKLVPKKAFDATDANKSK